MVHAALPARRSFSIPSRSTLLIPAIAMAAVALLLPVRGARAQAFNPGVRVDLNTGYIPPSIAISDLNGDGKPDLIVGNNGGLNAVSVLLGTGNGGLGAVAQYATGPSPLGLAVADLNNDGKPDIAIVNSGSNSVSVLLGTGTGSFGTRTDFGVGGFPTAVATGDLNGDGIQDLAVTNAGTNTVTVLLGNGTGGFSRADFATGSGPTHLAIADLNGDGKLDIVTANKPVNTISVLLGNGAGGFAAKTDYATAVTPEFVALGDLNYDGVPDVAVATYMDILHGAVSVLLNTGNGTLGPKTDITFGSGAQSVAIADLNGDTLPDLVVATDNDAVNVLPGNGNGTFGPAASFGAGSRPIWLAIGDLNGDGRLDIATADFNSSGITILFANGNGFAARNDYGTGANPYAVAIGDVNGDGKKDLAVADAGGGSVSVLLGNGTGGFGGKTDFTTGTAPYAIAIADLNADAKPDLIAANNSSNTISVLLGTGTGSFGAKTDFATGVSPYSVAIGDLNGDAKPDAVVANNGSNTISVLLGTGTGTFGAKTDFTTGSNPQAAVIADMNGDAKLDVIVVNNFSSTVSVMLGNGLGSLGARNDFATGTNPDAVAVGDLNGDGKPDVVTANVNAASISVLTGTGTGTLNAKTDYTALTNPSSISIADFNGDGRLDVEVGYLGTSTVSVFLGNGAGGLGTRNDITVTGQAFGSTAGDLNADGRPDIVSANYLSGSVSVLLGLEPARVALTTSPTLAVPNASYVYSATMSVPAPGSGTPTGTVSYYDGLRFVGSSTLNAGVATISTFKPFLPSHTLYAYYSGDGKFLPAVGQVSMSTSLGPHIALIHDLPNDQGGHVDLRWDASPLDRVPNDPITQYKIWRQLPGGLAAQQIASGARRLVDPARGAPQVGDVRVTRYATQTLYWEYLATQISGGYPGYSFPAATLADSVGTSNPRTSFMVEADEPSDGLYWSSAPDSGYSVDNLPPAAVTPFTGTYSAGTVTLHWGTSTAPDFASYLVYRGMSPNFVPAPGNLVTSQPDTGYADHTPLQYYKLAAEDLHGNIGPYTLLQLPVALAVEGGAGYAFALDEVKPNPALGRKLSVRFTLADREPAELEMLDIAGRRVWSREVGALGAGPHEVSLGVGRALPPGLYLVRLTEGPNVRTARAAILN